jgi:hypothetical protein
MTHYLTRPDAIEDRENFPRQEDCPDCGLPTLVAERFASYEPPVRLDPMPVVVFTRNAAWPHGATVSESQHPATRPASIFAWHYVEHRCPMPVAL